MDTTDDDHGSERSTIANAYYAPLRHTYSPFCCSTRTECFDMTFGNAADASSPVSCFATPQRNARVDLWNVLQRAQQRPGGHHIFLLCINNVACPALDQKRPQAGFDYLCGFYPVFRFLALVALLLPYYVYYSSNRRIFRTAYLILF